MKAKPLPSTKDDTKDAATLVVPVAGVFDVTDPQFGARCDGTPDSDHIQEAIDAALAAFPVEFSGDSPWPSTAAVVRFPVVKKPAPDGDPDYAGFYLLDKPLHISAGQSIALVGDAGHGPLLRYDGDGAAIVIHGVEGSQAVSFERLVIQGGGALIAGKNTVGVTFRDTAFSCVQGWAIESIGDVGWVRIRNCHITGTGTKDTGGVHVGEGAHHWEVTQTAFVRVDGRSILVRGRDIQVRDCDFNGNVQESRPYVHIQAPAQRVLLQNVRFGNEYDSIPDHTCLISPSEVGPSECILDVRLDRCVFRGHKSIPTTPVRVETPVRGLRLDHCAATHAFTQLIDEAVVGLATMTDPQDVGQEIPTSRCGANLIEGLYAAGWYAKMPMFTHGGHGFEVQGRLARAAAPRGLVGGAAGNLLRWTESLVAKVGDVSPWRFSTSSAMFPLQDELTAGTSATVQVAPAPSVCADVDPPCLPIAPPMGSPWAVWEIRNQPPKSPSCIAQAVNSAGQGSIEEGPLVFSVWLRGDASSDLNPRAVRLEIRVIDSALAARSSSVVIALRSRWRRHHVVAEGIPKAAPVMVVAYHGDGIATWAGSFWLSMPQLEAGRVPREYRPVGDVPLFRTDRPMGARLIGGVQVQFGKSYPKDPNQRFEVGDRVLSTEVTTGSTTSPVGWVCVKADAPGTWRELGGHE